MADASRLGEVLIASAKADRMLRTEKNAVASIFVSRGDLVFQKRMLNEKSRGLSAKRRQKSLTRRNDIVAFTTYRIALAQLIDRKKLCAHAVDA